MLAVADAILATIPDLQWNDLSHSTHIFTVYSSDFMFRITVLIFLMGLCNAIVGGRMYSNQVYLLFH